MVQSYNTLVNALTQFSNAHMSVRRFKCSFFEQLPNFSTGDNSFPLLYAIPNDISFDENIDRMLFRVYCIDALQKDRSNEQVILNETLLILRDLTNWFRLNQFNNLNILNNPRAIPVNNFVMDFTAGWYVDFEIETTPETNDCSIPFSDNFILTGITCDNTYVNNFLTCETLVNCPNLPGYINSITSGDTNDTFVTGYTYDNINTFTISRNQGLSNLTASITALTLNTISATTYLGLPADNDNYVTGFTYTPNTLVIKRNNGLSDLTVTINNFTGLTVNGSFSATTYLGLPADNDNYVTGGTVTSNVLILNRTNGSVIIPISLTGTTGSGSFTGNTSASCITDLWISNLHGCSPITVHDNFQNITSSATGLFSNAFGSGNTASGPWSVVSGGHHNKASGTTATIGGGYNNIASGTNSFIGGGHDCVATMDGNIVVGGCVNRAIGDHATIVGGRTNLASGNESFIGGGDSNQATGVNSTVTGGLTNTASGNYSTIGGGRVNIASATNSTVAGGRTNTASGVESFIGGGKNNTAYGYSSVVAGGGGTGIGAGNTASGNRSVIGGGKSNTASGDYSSIIGGKLNTVSHFNSHIIGSNITTIASGFTYVNSLNIQIVSAGTLTDTVLVRSSDGTVKSISTGSLSGNTGSGIDTFVTGFTYDNYNTFTITRNQGLPNLTASLTALTLSTISATTYLGLPSSLGDNYVTGGTMDNINGVLTLNRTNGSVIISGFTDTDNYVTGGTYTNGFITLNRTNGSVVISGLLSADTFVTGFTYAPNTLTISRNQGLPDLQASINNFTGLTINGILSATTYVGLPIDPDNYVTGGTVSSNVLTLNRQNGSVIIPISLTGDTDNYVTGGTVSSNVLILERQNGSVIIPISLTGFSTTDTFVTGYTYDNYNTFTIIRNQGLPNLTASITALTLNTISATTYLGLPSSSGDNYVTGGTWNSTGITLYRTNGEVLITASTGSVLIATVGFMGGALSPADGVTYYQGNSILSPTTPTTPHSRIPTGVIRGASLSQRVNGTLGTAEHTTYRLFNGVTSATTFLFTGRTNNNQSSIIVEDLNIPVSSLEYYSIATVSPTFGTNPTAVHNAFELRVFSS